MKVYLRNSVSINTSDIKYKILLLLFHITIKNIVNSGVHVNHRLGKCIADLKTKSFTICKMLSYETDDVMIDLADPFNCE